MASLKITRRTFNATLAGGAAAAALPSASFAAEVSTLTVGDIEVSFLSDGHIGVPADFFQNASAEALAAAGNPIEIGATLWLLKTGGRLVMVDTGSGEALSGMFPTVGKLDVLLQGLGIQKSAITDIVLTHMHADHIGGLMGENAGGFENARIHVNEAEWGFWTNPGLADAVPVEMQPMVQLVQAIAEPLTDKVSTYAAESDLGDGLTLVPMVGHTPGHSGVLVQSGGDAFWIVGDAVISQALQFDDPSVAYALDADPAQAIKTRVELLTKLAESGAVFAATHLQYPGVGRVERNGEGFAFLPLA